MQYKKSTTIFLALDVFFVSLKTIGNQDEPHVNNIVSILKHKNTKTKHVTENERFVSLLISNIIVQFWVLI